MSAWNQVEQAIDRISDGKARLLAHKETPWQTATFDGSRHELTLHFEGEAAAATGEAMLAELPRHEITLGGHVVCETKIVWRNWRKPAIALTVQLELLLVKQDRKAA